ncbi:ethyl tert-butyl ether degradation protein EthD [Burkholderia sp. MR1-5-21]
MEVCLFLIADHDGGHALSSAAGEAASALRAASGLKRLVAHRPIALHADPADTAPRPPAPSCVLQCYFDELAALEAMLVPNGPAHAFVTHCDAHGHRVAQQAMAVRRIGPDRTRGAREADERCTYLVGYDGHAHDMNAWLAHYLDHHPPLMLQLPGIREIEIYTRVDYRSALAVQRADAMQRNKVVFDHPDALVNALASPVRRMMRQDFDALPPFAGATPHFPMASRVYEITSIR